MQISVNTVTITPGFMSEKEMTQTQMSFNLVKNTHTSSHLSSYLWPLCLTSSTVGPRVMLASRSHGAR